MSKEQNMETSTKNYAELLIGFRVWYFNLQFIPDCYFLFI